jgi:hypothetical protein
MKFLFKNPVLIVSSYFLGVLMLNATVSFILMQSLYLIAVVDIIYNKDRNFNALKWAGFFVSIEVSARMTSGFVFWEFGKYSNILLMLIGLAFSTIKPAVKIYFFYILLLLLGISFSNIPSGESIRKAIAFNLSGPVQLGIAAIYCYGTKISKNQLLQVLFYSLLGLMPLLAILYNRTPDIPDIIFGGVSNFAASGGFGPNQVSTLLGFGIFIIVVLISEKKDITGYRIIDYLLLSYFIYRGLLTFSRGGVISAGLSSLVYLIFYLTTNKGLGKNLFKYFVLGGFFLIGVFTYTSNLTGGMLDNRYSNRNAQGEKKADLSAGRSEIFKSQFESWLDNPFFGTGVGSGKYNRIENHGGITAASHNEISRLLEEHGLIGLVCLLMLLITAIRSILYQDFENWGILLGFLSLWFLTINHSAMRTAFPGFMYAVSLLIINRLAEEKG